MIAMVNGKEEYYTVVLDASLLPEQVGLLSYQHTTVEVCGGRSAECSWHSDSDIVDLEADVNGTYYPGRFRRHFNIFSQYGQSRGADFCMRNQVVYTGWIAQTPP